MSWSYVFVEGVPEVERETDAQRGVRIVAAAREHGYLQLGSYAPPVPSGISAHRIEIVTDRARAQTILDHLAAGKRPPTVR